MRDIVDKLRDGWRGPGDPVEISRTTLLAAIDEIKRLRNNKDYVLMPSAHNISDAMVRAFYKAWAEYEKMRTDKVFPRPTLAAYVYSAIVDAGAMSNSSGILTSSVVKESLTTEPADIFECPIAHPGCVKNCGSYGCGN